MAGSIAQQAPFEPLRIIYMDPKRGKTRPECKAAIKATRPFFTAKQIPPAPAVIQ
jgi:hypothetical protein